MFTGIVQTTAPLIDLDARARPARVSVDLGELARQVARGDSVALDGCCLTATRIDPAGPVTFDAIPETLSRTTLGGRRRGYRFNVELAVTPTTRLGGHFVQGHVDGVGTVTESRDAGGQWRIAVRCDRALTDTMAPKGSVALGGVSLTLTEVDHGRFAVALIPATLEGTNLRELRPGDAVNVETDMILKFVARRLGMPRGGQSESTLTEGFLSDHGFC